MLTENNNYQQFAEADPQQAAGSSRTSAFSTTRRSATTSRSSRRTQAPKNLSEPEQKLYDLVTRRFMAVFFPAAEFSGHDALSPKSSGHQFKTEGKVMTNPGWLAIYGKEAAGDETRKTPARWCRCRRTKKSKTEKIAANGLVTKPPARYIEATLLSAMEGAGKLSTTKICAKRWPARASARRPRARRSSKAC